VSVNTNPFYDVRDVLDDATYPDRWFLQAPVDEAGIEVDPRIFTYSKPVNVTHRLWLPLRGPGTPLDFTFADFGMPVVTRAVGEAIFSLAPEAVQRIPVSVESTGQPYEILNILSEVRCLNEERSVYQRWTEADGRPDKVGQYRGVNPIVLDAGRAAGHHIFRLGGWKVIVIVSEQMKRVLEGINTTGIQLAKVEVT
jgi:hypothetical protein